MKLKEVFLLNWRKVGLVVIGWFIAVALHNLIYAATKIEEGFFLILATIVLPAYILVAGIYSLIKHSKK